MPTRRLGAIAVVSLAALAAGCRHAGEFVWVDAVPDAIAAPEGDGSVIAPGDLVSVRVWSHENLSARVQVRPDGKVSVPFVDDLVAAGETPDTVARRIQVRLRTFLVNPVVTVAIDERSPLDVFVLGEVAKPGRYRLADGGLLQALASAGGLTEYGHRDRIYLLRSDYWADRPELVARVRFRYDALIGARGKAATFRLRDGDVVVVE